VFTPEIGRLVDGLTKIKRLDLVSKRAAQGENFRNVLQGAHVVQPIGELDQQDPDVDRDGEQELAEVPSTRSTGCSLPRSAGSSTGSPRSSAWIWSRSAPAHAAGQRRVDVEGLLRDAGALLCRHVLQGAHVVT
jgi:hypothetical protein